MPPDSRGFILQAATTTAMRVAQLYRLLCQRHRKWVRLTSYMGVALLVALVFSMIFGEHYDATTQKARGPARRLDTREATGAPPLQQQDGTLKDPYGNRPRIRTKNGHLYIEASQDKNVEFRTSGSRGSVSINGHKLDQLLDVARALERTSAGGKPLVAADGSTRPSDQYELVLRNLMGSSERVTSLEKRVAELAESVANLGRRAQKMSKALRKRTQKLESLDKQFQRVLKKLRRNDCVSEDTGTPVCKNGATCLDMYDEFKCLCPDNFEGDTCEQDVDECAKFRGTDLGCQNGAACVNLPGGYKCTCPAEFHGVHCTERHDDCAMSSSRALCGFGKCIQLARVVPNQPRFECQCDQGWTTDGTNPECIIDVNECQPPPLNQTEAALAAWSPYNSYRYPCSIEPYVECVNLPGAFQCGPCPAGYTGDGRQCYDLNECLVDNGGCSMQPLVECINTPGARRCGLCPAGYTGDGVTCTQLGACSAEGQPNGGCHPMARCVELAATTPPARICICQWPTQGQGVGPDGCQAAGGSAVVPPTTSTNETVDNDCRPNPCLHEGTCLLTDASFECICAPGWTGRVCDEQSPSFARPVGQGQQADGRVDANSCGGGRFYQSQGRVQFPPPNGRVKATSGSISGSGSASSAGGERQYECKWSIAVAANMSVRLAFSNVANKVNPAKKVQFFLTNQTTTSAGHLSVPPPTCSESLDVWEQLLVDARPTADSSSRRLLARFCTDRRSLLQATEADGRELVIVSEANQVELKYSFAATRTQFGEPSLAFNLNWSQVAPPCGGEWQVADSGGSLSSPNFPEFYPAGTECRYLLRAGAQRRVRLQFGELSLLTSTHRSRARSPSSNPPDQGTGSVAPELALDDDCADSLTVLDGSIGSDRPVLFRFCANDVTLVSSAARPVPPAIVSSSSSVEIILDSRPDSVTPLMRPRQRRGFFITYSTEPGAPGCGGLWTQKSGTIKSADYEPSQVDELRAQLASQMTNLFDPAGDAGASGSSESARQPHFWSGLSNFLRPDQSSNSSGSNNQQASANQQSAFIRSLWWYKTRCEFEVRPADQKRNHKVALDWLEMPYDLATEPGSLLSLATWTRQVRCARARLIVYDSRPQDSTGRSELAVFCAGDRYNASLATLTPLVSRGHLLYLVYESSISMSDESQAAALMTSTGAGFKLHYSTICSAIYQQPIGRIQVHVDSEVRECIYHIMLPPNNTITLLVEPPLSPADTNLLADPASTGSGVACAAKAVFMDGAIQGGRLALASAERELKSYNFARAKQQQQLDQVDLTARAGRAIDLSATSDSFASGQSNGDSSDAFGATDTDSAAPNSSSYYWQYSSTKTHDIKEFEVCKLPSLSFDSIWNHLSLLFRYDPAASGPSAGRSSKAPVKLSVAYRAEPTCGGIISEPRAGSIRLDSRQQSPKGEPPTGSEPCSWVLRASQRHAIQLEFSVHQDEIKRRVDEWKKSLWRPKSLNETSNNNSTAPTKATTPVVGQQFECGQLFRESVELYEPMLNRSRLVCPSEFIGGPNATRWTGQSNVLLVRLHMNSVKTNASASANKTKETKPTPAAELSKLKLLGPIDVKYKFVSPDWTRQACGGRLIHDSGLITTPRYPFKYPVGLNCVWTIQVQPGQQIRLNITKFELEKQSYCVFDYLELRNGPAPDSPLIGRFCSRDLESKVIVSHSNAMWLQFVSDMHLNGQGFEIYYDGAQTGCGGRLTTASGQIESPNYPYPAAQAADCEWTIELSQSNQVELTIEDLELLSEAAGPDCGALPGSNSSSTSSSALVSTQANYLAVYDIGSNRRYGKLLARLCRLSTNTGANNKTRIVSSGNKLTIVYKSQALDNSRGFRLTYKSLCRPVELVGFGGVIESPGYPLGYALNLQCGWSIRGPLGSNLTLVITDLDIEAPTMTDSPDESRCSNDHLDILVLQPNSTETQANKTKATNGKSYPDWRLERRLCGSLDQMNETSRVVAINSNQAQVRFVTDRSVEMRGFRIEWRAQGCGDVRQWPGANSEITYNEQSASGNKPYECFWTLDLTQSHSRPSVGISSDMRLPSSASDGADRCAQGSLTVYDGWNDKAPILVKNCDSLIKRVDAGVSSGRALVRFYSDGTRNYGRSVEIFSGWTSFGSCIASDHAIGAGYNRVAGERKSPLYPDLYDSVANQCDGSFDMTSDSDRLKIKLEELDIPIEQSPTSGGGLIDAKKCRDSGNYLMFKSGELQRNVEQVYCGHLDPSSDPSKGEWVTASGSVTVSFATSSAGLRGRWRFTYTRLCGGHVDVDHEMQYSSANYPNRPQWPDTATGNGLSENVCVWRFRAADAETGKMREAEKRKVHLSIVQFDGSTGNGSRPDDCLRIYEGVELDLHQSRFNLTDLDRRFEPKLKLCRDQDLKLKSLYYVSQGQEVYALGSGSTLFKISVRPYENYCGADLQMDAAELASPNYPQPYDPDLDCSYFIRGAPGSRIKLDFAAFELPEPELVESGDDDSQMRSCDNVDYVEIRQVSFSKKIRAKLDRLGKIVSDRSTSGLASNKRNAGNSTQDAKQKVVAKAVNQRLVEMTRFYNLIYKSANYEDDKYISMIRSQNSVRDFFDNSQSFGRFCGKQAPRSQFMDSNLLDEIVVRFRSHQPASASTKSAGGSKKKQARGFLASYKIVYGGLIQLNGPDEATMLEGGFIASPQFPGKSTYGKAISWTFSTKLHWRLQFDLVAMDLGPVDQDCQDMLSIYDGPTRDADKRLSKLCGHLSFKDLRLNTRYRPTLLELALLDVDKTSGPQLVALNLAHDPVVRVNLLRSVRSSSNVATVVYDNFVSGGFFLLRYRAFDPRIVQNQTGSATDAASSSADLAISERDDGLEEDANLSQQAVLANSTCSRAISLSFVNGTNSSEAVVTSPDWPNAPPPNIECHWLIHTLEDTTISLMLDPQLGSAQAQYRDPDSDYDRECSTGDLIVVHDGATRLAPTLGRFCLPVGLKLIRSTGRHLLVRYVRRNSATASGGPVRIRASINECGGHYHVASYARITDRPAGKSKNYANNLRCVYYLFADNINHVLAFGNSMSNKMELASEPTNADCSVGDYIEVRDVPILSEQWDFSRSMTGALLGRFCAGRKFPSELESPGPALSIEFKTDSANTAAGWRLAVLSTSPKLTCPLAHTPMREPFGQLSSPNWPHGYFGKRHCKYHLVAPIGSGIELTFVKLQRQHDASSGRCLDSLSYLADEEASVLRYDSSTSLHELRSPLSGTLLRSFVKDVECKKNETLALRLLTATLTANGTRSMEKIDASTYWSLIGQAGANPIQVKTSSRVLMLDYEANNVLAGQGFMAVYRTFESAKQEARCRGKLATHTALTPQTTTPVNLDPSGHMFESDKFGVQMQESEEYITCEWELDEQSERNSYDSLFAGHDHLRYSFTSSKSLSSFNMSYLVFQVIEVPSQSSNKSLSLFGERDIDTQAASSACGLTRLAIVDYNYRPSALFCGNLTDKYRWTILDYSMRRISLRTKNLRSPNGLIHRGVRGYLYERICPGASRLLGEAVRFVSHMEYDNQNVTRNSYPPGICKWGLVVGQGEHELWFESIRFRPPPARAGKASVSVNASGYSVEDCDTSDKDMDYVELRASQDLDAPVLARFCYNNQQVAPSKEKPMKLNSLISNLSILFVSGMSRLLAGSNSLGADTTAAASGAQPPLGFDMQLIRTSNSSLNKFCRRDAATSIYGFLTTQIETYSFRRTPANFLYPKNAHCVVPMNLDAGQRFNFSFVGMFDLESSKDCQNDYVQIESLTPKSNTTVDNVKSIVYGNEDDQYTVKRLGKWCGRDRPKGYFTSDSEKVRLIFHSNERVEGRGFLLEIAILQPNNSSISRRIHFKS